MNLLASTMDWVKGKEGIKWQGIKEWRERAIYLFLVLRVIEISLGAYKGHLA